MKAHSGFILIPGKKYFVSGAMKVFADHMLAVLVVLIHHENRKTRRCFPSQDLIALEAGIGKQNVASATGMLEGGGFLVSKSVPSKKHGVRTEYEMQYEPYEDNPVPNSWIGMQSAVVSNGIWSAMPHSAKRLYLLLLALSWDGSWADISVDACQKDFSERENWGCGIAGRFVDATKLVPGNLADLSGLHERTLRRAREWLFSNGLIVPNDEQYRTSATDLYREGIMIIDARNRVSTDFQHRKRTLQTQAASPSKGARISLTRLKTCRPKKNVLVCINSVENDPETKLGHDNGEKRTLQPTKPDTTIP